MKRNQITTLEINNFKSIKSITMDCKRINVLIGRPNVGKSNILEALSLFIAPYDNSPVFLKNYVRYDKLSNLFYDQDRKNQISVKTNIGFAAVRYHMNGIDGYDVMIGSDINLLNLMNEDASGLSLNDQSIYFKNNVLSNLIAASDPTKPYFGSINDNQRINTLYRNGDGGYATPFKNYKFRPLQEFKNNFPSFLSPPSGDNLFTILEGNPDLYNEVASFFNKYNLDLVLNIKDEEIVVQKQIGRRVFHTPYFLSADTLQRIIFHLAAIKTNKDSILLLEEPESHSFPPYISKLADAVIESKDNQFFIATHSPYLLSPFLTKCDLDEIAVSIVDYKGFETTIKVLSNEEIQNLIDSEADLFINLAAFQE